MILHNKLYSSVIFFKDKDRSFIAWISMQLKPLNVEEQKHIYTEGEEVMESNFDSFTILYSVLFSERNCGLCHSKIQ